MAKFRYLQSELPTERQALLLSDLANIAGVALDQEEGRKRKLFALGPNKIRMLYDLCAKLEKAGDRALDIANTKTTTANRRTRTQQPGPHWGIHD